MPAEAKTAVPASSFSRVPFFLSLYLSSLDVTRERAPAPPSEVLHATLTRPFHSTPSSPLPLLEKPARSSRILEAAAKPRERSRQWG